MTRYEIQIRDYFIYVVASSQEAALIEARKQMSNIERRFVTPLFTGRDIAGY